MYISPMRFTDMAEELVAYSLLKNSDLVTVTNEPMPRRLPSYLTFL